jgi:manganese transport protein
MSQPEERELRAAPTRLAGLLRAIGPGIVVIGSIMGSGELINTPIQAAKFGFVLLWAVIISCVIKYFLQVEFGRHALAHNRTPFQAFGQCPGPKIRGASWIGLAYLVGFTFTLFASVGMLRATAGLLNEVVALLGDEQRSVDLWSVIVTLLVLAMLWRDVYQDLEKLITLMVGIFSGSVLIGVCLIQRTEFAITTEQIRSGLTFSLGPDSEAGAYAVISLLGALGATANEIFMYPYWILEKGYGRHLGSPESPDWTERTRGWIRVLQFDVAVCTLLATVVTAAYFLMGAAVFFGHGETPQGNGVLTRLSAMYTQSFGTWSYAVFIAGAFCTLLSTLVVGIAAGGRMWADMLASLELIDGSNPRSRHRTHRTFETVAMTGCLILGVALGVAPEKLVIFGQYVNGVFCTPLLMLAVCWLAFKTDKRVRMNGVTAALLIASVIVITACIAGPLLAALK